jgi:hypothetical protein
MNRACPFALLAAGAIPLFVTPTAAAASRPVTAELAQCVALSAPDARLACYDALAGRNAGAPAPGVAAARAAAVPAPAPAPSPTLTPTPTSAPALPATSAAASAAAAVPAPTAPREEPSNFGFSAPRQATAPKSEVIQSIQAHVTQVPANQLSTSYVALDNGQTWKSTDGDMSLFDGEAVTIKRAALGSFMLSSASNHSYHVRRIR